MKKIALILMVLSAFCFGRRMYDFGAPVVSEPAVELASEPVPESAVTSVAEPAVKPAAESAAEPVAETAPAQETPVPALVPVAAESVSTESPVASETAVSKPETSEQAPSEQVSAPEVQAPASKELPYKAVGLGETLTPEPDLKIKSRAADSAAYYRNIAEKMEKNATWFKDAGTPMVVAGGVAASIGVLMMISGITEVSTVKCVEKNGKCEFEGSLWGVHLIGDLMVIAGAASIATGLSFKILSGYQMDRAKYYRNKAEKFEKNSNVYISLVPRIDLINGRLGSVAMISF